MIKIDTKYTRFILPGIILQGEERHLREMMKRPEYVKKIGIPESCLFCKCKYDLVPIPVAENYFAELGLL
jgi:hypothetical protein